MEQRYNTYAEAPHGFETVTAPDGKPFYMSHNVMDSGLVNDYFYDLHPVPDNVVDEFGRMSLPKLIMCSEKMSFERLSRDTHGPAWRTIHTPNNSLDNFCDDHIQCAQLDCPNLRKNNVRFYCEFHADVQGALGACEVYKEAKDDCKRDTLGPIGRNGKFLPLSRCSEHMTDDELLRRYNKFLRCSQGRVLERNLCFKGQYVDAGHVTATQFDMNKTEDCIRLYNNKIGRSVLPSFDSSQLSLPLRQYFAGGRKSKRSKRRRQKVKSKH